MDDKNVRDLTMRRKAQLQKDDPVLKLADLITKLLADHATKVSACDQLVAVELSGRAICEVLRHSLGEIELNGILLDAQQKVRSYNIEWPEHDQSPTVYDKPVAPEQAKVVRIAPPAVKVHTDDDLK